MKEKLIAWMNSRRYNSHLMRLIVGGYVVYLGGKIMVNQYEAGSFAPALSLCAVALMLCGIPVALVSFWAVYNGYSEEYKGNTELRKKQRLGQADEEEESETKD